MNKLILIAAITLFSFRPESAAIIHRLIVLPESKLTVSGRTNLSGFECVIERYSGRDTLVLHEGMGKTRPVFVQGAIQLDAEQFDCGMAIMTSDFQRTINSEVYPAITIDFISLERTPAYSAEREKFKGILKISIAGVTRLFEVMCDISAKPTGVIELVGEREFTFGDFNLKAPTRMLGAVKVEKTLKVMFELQLMLDPEY